VHVQTEVDLPAAKMSTWNRVCIDKLAMTRAVATEIADTLLYCS